MQSGLVLRVISSLCLVAAARAGAQNSESVAILGCRRAAADEVRKTRVTADSVLFTLYPQVFPRTQFETDLVDYGQYFDRVQRVWVPFNFGCTYNYQSSVARVSITYAGMPLAPTFSRGRR